MPTSFASSGRGRTERELADAIERRLEHFYVYTVHNDGEWVKAGRPRAPL